MTAVNIYALGVIKAGARAFILKESEIEELKWAIEILHGKIYISQQVAEIIGLQSLKISDTPFSALSARELPIATLQLACNTVSKIAKILELQNWTIGTYKTRIFQKLKITSLPELKEMSAIYNF